jgi:hypothetical protein
MLSPQALYFAGRTLGAPPIPRSSGPRGYKPGGSGTVHCGADGGNRAPGNNERGQLAGIRPFLGFVYRAVTDVAAAR